MEAETKLSVASVGDDVGPYRLLRLIGAGASGQVFEVEHQMIGRRAALKLLNPDHALLPSALRRLFAEAQAVNRINNPHIVEITDLVEPTHPGTPAGVVMELLEGASLAELISDGKRLPMGRIPGLMAQVAGALAAAHDAGFVHRDLKPENIFITQRDGLRDYVKLLDFGLAKSLVLEEESAASARDTLPGRSHRTVEGTFLGTPAYASPEQAAGKPVDHRTDIYALGVILYELLCGQLPFHGNNMGEYLVKHITMTPPPVPPAILSTPLGAALGDIALRCLRKDPDQRFSSAAEIRERLLALSGEEVGEDQMPTTVRWAWAVRRMRWAAVGAIALGALAIVLGLALTRRSTPVGSGAPRAEPAAVMKRAPASPRIISAPKVEATAGQGGAAVAKPETKRKRAGTRAPGAARKSVHRERTLNPWQR